MTDARSERQLSRWRETRKMGRTRYVVLFGMLGWGVPWALIWSAIMWFTGILAAESYWQLLGIALATGLVGGVAFGLIMWHWSERRYHQLGQ